jgi:hypothetical protein
VSDEQEQAPPGELTKRQQQGLIALLNTNTVKEAAAESGIPTRTLFSWIADPVFGERLREAQAQILDSALLDLQRASTKAVATLVRNMDCGNAPTEVRAATAVLDLAIRAKEVDLIREQLDQLARDVEFLKGGQDGNPAAA